MSLWFWIGVGMASCFWGGFGIAIYLMIRMNRAEMHREKQNDLS